MKKFDLYTYQHEGLWEVWNTEANDGWYAVRKCLGKFLSVYHAELFIEAWRKAERIVTEDAKRRSCNEWSELKLYDLMGGKKGLHLSSNEAFDAYCAPDENFYKPLVLLEQSFKAAGLDIDLVGQVEFISENIQHKNKVVEIIQNGCFKKRVSIEGDRPAMAVKDVAEGVQV